MQGPVTTAILLLATLSASVFASPASGAQDVETNIRVVSRQFTPAILSTGAACLQYSQIANMSVIGGNSSYRTAFLEQSPVGTLANSAMLNKAIAVAPNLTADAQLNEACGNLTAVAIQEAAANFSRGIVAQFTFTGNPASVVNGPIIILVVVLCLLIQMLPLTAL